MSEFKHIQLLTTKQAAEYLNISPKTLEKYRYEGGGPHYIKKGRLVRYTLIDLEKWIENLKYASTSEYV